MPSLILFLTLIFEIIYFTLNFFFTINVLPHRLFSVKQHTRCGRLTPLQRSGRCILQPQPIGQTNPGSNNPQNNSCSATYFPSQKLSQTCGAVLGKQGRTPKWHSLIDLSPDVQVLADQRELIYIKSVQTQDVVWMTCREWWMTGTKGEKEPGKFVLSGWLNYEDYFYFMGDFLNSYHLSDYTRS